MVPLVRTEHLISSFSCSLFMLTVTSPEIQCPPCNRISRSGADGRYLPGASKKLNRPTTACFRATATPTVLSCTPYTTTLVVTSMHFLRSRGHSNTLPLSRASRTELWVGSESPHAAFTSTSPITAETMPVLRHQAARCHISLAIIIIHDAQAHAQRIRSASVNSTSTRSFTLPRPNHWQNIPPSILCTSRRVPARQ